jgi:hypothetical protein
MHGCLSIDFVTKWWHYLVKSDVMPLLWLIFQGQRMRHLIDKRVLVKQPRANIPVYLEDMVWRTSGASDRN